ncbi:MAG: hypothetical protein PHP64_08340 [Actinomycetota bacterium]|nr:hypothetical protein [Actinomycetota bacterium]
MSQIHDDALVIIEVSFLNANTRLLKLSSRDYPFMHKISHGKLDSSELAMLVHRPSDNLTFEPSAPASTPASRCSLDVHPHTISVASLAGVAQNATLGASTYLWDGALEIEQSNEAFEKILSSACIPKGEHVSECTSSRKEKNESRNNL